MNKRDQATIAAQQVQSKIDNEAIVAVKKQLAELQTSSAKSTADLRAQLKTANDEASTLTKKCNDLTIEKTAFVKQVEALIVQGKRDSDEIAALKKKILELDGALKKSSDELTALSKLYKDLTSAKAAVDKQVEALTAQGKKDASEIASQKKQLDESAAKLTAIVKEYQAYKTTSENTVSNLNSSLAKAKDEYAQHLQECKLAAEKAATSITNLEGTNKQMKDQMTGLTMEYQTYKSTSEQNIADLNTTSTQLKDKLLSLAKEYQGFKTSSEASINSLTVSLNKVQSEYSQHLNICTADRAAAQSTIDELEGFVKKPRGFECTDSVSGGNRGFSMPSKSGHVTADNNKGTGNLVTYVHPGEMPSVAVAGAGATDLRAIMGLTAAGATADRSVPTDLRATMGLPPGAGAGVGAGAVVGAGGEGSAESAVERPAEGVIFNWWDLITPSQ